MTTEDRIRNMKTCTENSNANIAEHQRRNAEKRCEALKCIRAMSDPTITPEIAARAIGCNPHYIRVTARNDPKSLGFQVFLSGNRTHIMRKSFLKYVDGL